MEMEDHHFGMPDLRQLMNGKPNFPANPEPPEIFSGQQLDMMMSMMMPRAVTASTSTEPSLAGGDPNAGGSGRWARQETLMLLEIRSKLDYKFKETNQKGPSWDEVSRIMNEEHGYRRSGKKCREKFENLYKYYKKTKEGKAGRQDGKHYRFFRQLEALYGNGVTTNSLPETQFQSHKVTDSLSLSNCSEFESSSSFSNGEINTKKNKKKRNWRSKIKDFIDSQMKEMIEKQELWLEKLMQRLEEREKERLIRDQQWRIEEAARVDKECKFWQRERERVEARDSMLMAVLNRFTDTQKENQNVKDENMSDNEIARLIELVNGYSNNGQNGVSEEMFWEEIATKMGAIGYVRNPLIYKEKWNNVNSYLMQMNNEGSSPSSCLRLLMGEGDSNSNNLWVNYGLKLNNGENQ